MKPPTPESQLLHDVRKELGLERDLVMWRNSTGVTGGVVDRLEQWLRGQAENGQLIEIAAVLEWLRANATGDRRRHRYGLEVGSSDLICMLAPRGRLLAWEMKSSTGRVTPDQKLFLENVRRHGGQGAVIRTVDEAKAALERARQGACE